MPEFAQRGLFVGADADAHVGGGVVMGVGEGKRDWLLCEEECLDFLEGVDQVAGLVVIVVAGRSVACRCMVDIILWMAWYAFVAIILI